MSLSIFSFEKRGVRPSQSKLVRAGWQDSESNVAVLDEPCDEHGPSEMLLDLEHLTPEVLEKFFPSESTLAVGGR
jgi:hypothetical protein